MARGRWLDWTVHPLLSTANNQSFIRAFHTENDEKPEQLEQAGSSLHQTLRGGVLSEQGTTAKSHSPSTKASRAVSFHRAGKWAIKKKNGATPLHCSAFSCDVSH